LINIGNAQPFKNVHFVHFGFIIFVHFHYIIYSKLTVRTEKFFEALKYAPEKVREFINGILGDKKQEQEQQRQLKKQKNRDRGGR